MEWLSSSTDPWHRNIRLMTEFDSPIVSENLVGSGLVGVERDRSNKSAIIIRSLLIEE